MTIEITSYDSVEDMFEDMRRHEAAANERIIPLNLEVGRYTMRPTLVGNEMVLIFGEVWSLEDCDRSSRELCEDEEEAEAEIASMHNSYERNYRFGKFYSVMCPEGELGMAHLSTMLPISEEQFDIAKTCDWMLTGTGATFHIDLLRRAGKQEADKERA